MPSDRYGSPRYSSSRRQSSFSMDPLSPTLPDYGFTSGTMPSSFSYSRTYTTPDRTTRYSYSYNSRPTTPTPSGGFGSTTYYDRPSYTSRYRSPSPFRSTFRSSSPLFRSSSPLRSTYRSTSPFRSTSYYRPSTPLRYTSYETTSFDATTSYRPSSPIRGSSPPRRRSRSRSLSRRLASGVAQTIDAIPYQDRVELGRMAGSWIGDRLRSSDGIGREVHSFVNSLPRETVADLGRMAGEELGDWMRRYGSGGRRS